MKNRGLSARISRLLVGDAREAPDSDDEHDESKAKLVDADSDADEAAPAAAASASRSRLRAANAAKLADADKRYAGKKSSRKAVESELGLGGVGGDGALDAAEHAGADWGHMFEGDDGDDGSGSEDEAGGSDGGGGGGDSEDVDGSAFTLGGGDDVDFSKFGGMSDDDEEASEESEGAADEDQGEHHEGDEDVDSGDVADDVQKFSKRGGVAGVAAEVSKGRAIQRQLRLWDGLLETRIALQKALANVNQFPQPDAWNEFETRGDDDYAASVRRSQSSLVRVLEALWAAQTHVTNGFPETKAALKRPRRREPKSEAGDCSGSSDGDAASSASESESPAKKKKKPVDLREIERRLEKRADDIRPWRDAVIEKWNDKTRLASGVKAGKPKSFAAFETSTLKQIQHVLADKRRLVARTRVKRSSYRVLGRPADDDAADAPAGDAADAPAGDAADTPADDAADDEIFDDDDFYHQLLRELIERKTSGVTDPTALGQQWARLQKMRAKLKRKVDTKASKGRKTRYDIYAKLVNFMAPAERLGAATAGLADQAKNELFASLFGKNSRAAKDGE